MHKNALIQVLQIVPFRNLWVAQVVTQIVVNTLIFVLGVVIYETTASNTAVSVLYMAVGIPAAIFGIISGVFVDRLPKKMLLISTVFVRAGLVLLLIFSQGKLIPLYLMSALISIIGQFFIPAEAALIPHFVRRELLLPANSLFTMTFYSAIIGGFVAGGPLLNLLGWQTLLVFLAAAFVAAGTLLLFLPREPLLPSAHQLSFAMVVNDLRAGIEFIYKTISVRQAIILLLLAQSVIAIFASLGPGFADRILYIKLTDASILILGPAAIGMIFGALFISQVKSRFSRRKLITASIISSGLLFMLVASLAASARYELPRVVNVGILPIAITSFFCLGFANSLIDVTCNTILQEQTQEHMRGRVYGVLASLIGGVAILPVFVSGLLADTWGVGTVVFCLGLGLAGLGILVAKFHTRPVSH